MSRGGQPWTADGVSERGAAETSKHPTVSDISHSVAFVHLDNLVEEGEISLPRATQLKQLFQTLHNRVLEVYSHDNFLLGKARDLRKVLEEIKDEMKARAVVAKQDDEQITRLKKELQSAEADLCRAQEDESVLQVEALELERKKQTLVQDIEDAEAAEEARLRPQLERLEREVQTLTDSIDSAVRELTTLRQTRAELIDREAVLQRESAAREVSIADAKRNLKVIDGEPNRIMLQTGLVEKALAAAKNEMRLIESKQRAQAEEMSKLNLQQSERDASVAASREKLQKVRGEIEAKLKTFATLTASLEAEIDARQGYQRRIADLEGLILTAKAAGDEEAAAVDKALREKEQALRDYKAVEKAREDIISGISSIKEEQRVAEKSIENARAMRKESQTQLKSLRDQIAVRTRAFLQEQRREEGFVQSALSIIEEITELEAEIDACNARDVAREQELAQLTARRQNLCREVSRNVGRTALAQEELLSKDGQLRDINHRCHELEKRLDALLEFYRVVKKERNVKAAQIQSVSQRIAEMVEKARVLENELDVLCRESGQKESLLIKRRRETHELRDLTKQLRAEYNKRQQRLREAISKESAARCETQSKLSVVKDVGSSVVELRRAYEDAVAGRNAAGTSLIERNDELCVLYEHRNRQEAEIQDQTRLSHELNEKIRALTARLRDMERRIDIGRNSLPRVREAEDALVKTLHDIESERQCITALEQQLADPNNPTRWVSVGGSVKLKTSSTSTSGVESMHQADARLGGVSATGGIDSDAAAPAVPSAAIGDSAAPEVAIDTPVTEEVVQLEQKRLELEARLATVTERLLEKELLLCEVTELTSRLNSQVEDGRGVARALGRKMNALQADSKAKTKQMMAVVSELSVAQSSSMQLQGEISQMESLLAEARSRMAAGESPTDEADALYRKERAKKERYTGVSVRLSTRGGPTSASGGAGLSSSQGASSTAVPRPNAYIPQDGLGIPVPFGAHAPFIPTLHKSLSHGPVQPGARLSNTAPTSTFREPVQRRLACDNK